MGLAVGQSNQNKKNVRRRIAIKNCLNLSRAPDTNCLEGKAGMPQFASRLHRNCRKKSLAVDSSWDGYLHPRSSGILEPKIAAGVIVIKA
jgi:hypothetical protein